MSQHFDQLSASSTARFEPGSSVPAQILVHIDQIVVALHLEVVGCYLLEWKDGCLGVAEHVDLAVHTLLYVGLQICVHARSEHMLLCSLLDPC